MSARSVLRRPRRRRATPPGGGGAARRFHARPECAAPPEAAGDDPFRASLPNASAVPAADRRHRAVDGNTAPGAARPQVALVVYSPQAAPEDAARAAAVPSHPASAHIDVV